VSDTEINKAIAELQQNLPQIVKDLVGKVKTDRAQYEYNYADLAQISRELLPLLGRHGLAFVSWTAFVDGKFMVVYELRHVSGEKIPGQWPIPERASPQEIGSALTYARRNGLCATTGLAPEDEDHDAIVAEKAERRRRREPKQQAAAVPPAPPMNSDQQRKMQKLFDQLGVTEKPAKLKYAVDIVKRRLNSATELSFAEAEKVVAALTLEAEQPKVAAQADDGEAWLAKHQPPDGAGVTP
jgi:hypothetical protein